MVKRHNKTGRRQILQLEDKKPPPATTSKAPLRGIIHYSDSDDDSKKSPRECEFSVSSATEKDTNADVAPPIDSQVADFLKEIDALTVEGRDEDDDESSEAEPKQYVHNSDSDLLNSEPSTSSRPATANGDGKHKVTDDVETVVATTQSEDSLGVYCVWQQCHDDTTGYNYYWNIQTNEVTWECPPEYLAYLKKFNSSVDVSAAQSSQPSTSVESKSTAKPKTKKNYLKEGTIIPISYFGGTSSSDYSSDDDDSNSNIPDSPVPTKIIKSSTKQCVSQSTKVKPIDKNSTKNSLHRKDLVEAIGPQLPPDFQFPDDIPVTPSQSNSSIDGTVYNDKGKHEKVVEIGPQLPPDFVHFQTEIVNTSEIKNDPSLEVVNEAVTKSSVCLDEMNDDSNQDPTTSNLNGSIDQSLQKKDEASWEQSLLMMEKQFQNLNKNQSQTSVESAEIPDSTTRKESTPPKPFNVDSSEASVTHGFRPVVEYGSYTDDEEEDNELECTTSMKTSPNGFDKNLEPLCSTLPKPIAADISESEGSYSSKPVFCDIINVGCSNSPKPVMCDVIEAECFSAKILCDTEHEPECSNNLPQISNNNEQNLTKLTKNYMNPDNSNLVAPNDLLEKENSSAINSSNKVHIDIISNMFALGHDSGEKFGFGFGKSKQLELENDAFNSDTSKSNYVPKKKRRGYYPMINFVKSNNVLDLKTLNKRPEQSILPQASASEIVQTITVVKEKLPPSSECDEKLIEENQHDMKETNAIKVEQENLPILGTKNVLVVQDIVENVKDEIVKIDVKEDSVIVENERLPKPKQEKLPKVKKGDLNKVKKKKSSKVKPEEQPVTSENGNLDDIETILNNILKEKEEADSLLSRTLKEPSTSQKGKKHAIVEPDMSFNSPSKKLKKDETDQAQSEDVDVMSTIVDLSSVLMDKLSFLLSNHSNMASLTTLLIQIQTRLMDWQAGMLESKYFFDRLQEVHQYLHHYELGAVNGDWTCQWDSENKRYFYVNGRTNHSQWTFPTESPVSTPIPGKSIWANHMPNISTSSTSTFQTGAQFPLVSSSISEDQMHKHSSSSRMFMLKQDNHEMVEQYPSTSMNWMCQQVHPQPSPPPPPPGVDSPPPPPPKTPPPDSPPPPPPDSTELEEGEIPDVDMDLEDSNSFDSMSFARNIRDMSQSTKVSQPSQIPLKQLLLECSSTKSPEHRPKMMSTSMVSSTSATSSESAIIAKPPQTISNLSSSNDAISVSSGSSVASAWSNSSLTMPSCSSSQTVYQPSAAVSNDSLLPPGTGPSTSGYNLHVAEVAQMLSPVDYAIPSSSSASVQKPQAAGISAATIVKKEKKKSKLLAGLALKKKNIPSLVQKWQKIKEEQEKEDKNSDEARISTSM